MDTDPVRTKDDTASPDTATEFILDRADEPANLIYLQSATPKGGNWFDGVVSVCTVLLDFTESPAFAGLSADRWLLLLR